MPDFVTHHWCRLSKEQVTPGLNAVPLYEWEAVPGSTPADSAELFAARIPTCDLPALIEVQSSPAETTRRLLFSVEWRQVWRPFASLITSP